MFELNRAERRALVVASLLIAGGAGLRNVTRPGIEAYAWRPAAVTKTALPQTLKEARLAVKAGVALEERAARPLASGERIDPNAASEVDLRRLPGVGRVRAGAIVKARQERAFQSPDDLLRVAGIGKALLARVRPYLLLPREGRGSGEAEAGVDINAAGLEELAGLPWIGPSRARQILETRRRLGRFQSVDELIEVSGIGPMILERLRPYVLVTR